jgi:D-arabinose 5-phosphate isomerase GutQ
VVAERPTVQSTQGESQFVRIVVRVTIIAVNRDPDSPIGQFADTSVVADSAAMAPALATALRARAG